MLHHYAAAPYLWRPPRDDEPIPVTQLDVAEPRHRCDEDSVNMRQSLNMIGAKSDTVV
jgi:hypothetical protein